MNHVHKYTLALLVCIIIFIILIVIIPSTVKNNKSIEILNNKNKTLVENSKMDNETFGYSEILKVLNENNFKIISIDGDESCNINIKASFEKGVIDFYKYINVISNYKNLISIDNIAIEDSGKKILVSIRLIKNK